MRRLANQSRDDVYASSRDYQALEPRQGLTLHPSGRSPHRATFSVAGASSRKQLVAVGGFIRPTASIELTLRLDGPGELAARTYALDPIWSRVWLGISTREATTAALVWSGRVDLALWGFTGGPVQIPAQIRNQASPDDLLADHLAPETFYFPHDAASELELAADESTRITLGPGPALDVKKCAYCGRSLPVDPDRLGQLSFHKHNAKRTLHQNECRACKKWRINDSFNPIRTHDQLHESSVITRERKLLLREPEILQAIKDRSGAGLKSQIWERFGRKCFYCHRPLDLDEVRLDHTRPLAYLWPIDEHATCLCADHNGQKSDKFPVEFYSKEQLTELAGITGLSLAKLKAREFNNDELERILADPVAFALEWDPRLFASTAKRLTELGSPIDLMGELKRASPDIYKSLLDRLAERPDVVGD